MAGSHLLLPPMDFTSPLNLGCSGLPEGSYRGSPPCLEVGDALVSLYLNPVTLVQAAMIPSRHTFGFSSPHLHFIFTLPVHPFLTLTVSPPHTSSLLAPHPAQFPVYPSPYPYYTAEMVGDGDHDSDPSFHSPTTTSYCHMPTQHQAKSYFVV